MYYDRYFPFYVAQANPLLYGGEQLQEEEFQLMKSYYPETARIIQERVEEACEDMDYEGSRIYDEYPDKFMLYHLCQRIRRDVEPELEWIWEKESASMAEKRKNMGIQQRQQEEPDLEIQSLRGRFLDELIQVLLFQEITRRRCRRRRCRKFF